MVDHDRIAVLEEALQRLRASTRRLAGIASTALVAVLGLGAFVTWQTTRVPTELRVREGGRELVLAPDRVQLDLDGSPRALLDASSGVRIYRGDGIWVGVDAGTGLIGFAADGSVRRP
jgi:hypothetical protein